MSSQFEPQPPWQGWDSCRVFSAKECSIADLSPLRVKTATVENAVNRASILAFCQDRQVSEMSLFKLAWCVAVGTYAGVEDVCIGVRTSRDQSLLRCRLDPQKTAESLLSFMEEITLATNSNEGELANFANSTGLFDTTLSIGNSNSNLATNGMSVNGVHSGDCTTVHLLEAEVDLGGETIAVRYPFEMVSASGGSRAARLLSKCIAELLTHADERLSDLDILPPADTEEILAWNSKDLGSYDICLHQSIHERMEEAPDDQAVCAWDGDLTYRELDILSSHVGWKLQSLGVDTGASVAFLFCKSKWTVVSLLGILKAGGAAVALNPEFPIERSKHILEFTGARVLLVGRDLKGMLGISERGVMEMVVDEVLFPDVPSLSDERSRFVSSTVKPDDVAYIQFTSGSTGQPKGIMLEHRTYLANAVSQHEAFHVSKESRVLQFASHSFDAILVEVLTPLLAGACICIPSQERRLNDLAGAMRDLRVNWMGVTPTLAGIIKPKDVPSLRTLCTWGEAATSDIIETWADAVELINTYGPSENSVISTSHSWSKGIREPSQMGKGIKAVNTWIVRIDNRERLAPIGAVGELVVQGPTVARGYLHGEVRNVASFTNSVPWLPTGNGNQRMYHTGDLVRYTDDGCLEFLGRRDTQVKIRGHRVELGEIEHHINQSNARSHMTSVVEVIRPVFRPAQEMLIAFICERHDAATVTSTVPPLQPASDITRAKATAIEKHLTKYLPSHFVPSLYLGLDYMPTSASGKADRRRLRTMAESLCEMELMDYSSHSTSRKVPETATEILMAHLLAEILGIDAQKVSPDDSFFWLGGNSIIAMRLAVAARKQGLSVTVAQILQNPRLRQISSIISRQETTEHHPKESPSYVPFSSLSSVFADDFVRRVAVPHLGVAASDIEDMALATGYQIENLAWSSLKTRGGTNYITFDFRDAGLDDRRLQTAIERLVSHHAILRTVYFVYQRRVYQVALKQLPFDPVHHLQTKDVAETTSALIKADSRQPLDITQAIIKFWLIRDTEGQVKRLVLRASHLQYDGVTLIRWCRELGLACNGSGLYPTTSFFGYMHFAANHDEEGAHQFWHELLAGSSMTNIFQHSSIPWEHVLDGQVETLVDTAVVRSNSDITIGTTLKAAWSLVLAEMAGSGDVVFGSVIWGRNAVFPGVEDVAGACIDNIPVRVRLKPNMTRLELLQQVQGQYFQAVSFENYQYKRIVRECTDWKPWERLSTLVEYENLGEESSRFNMDQEHGFTVDEIRPPADRHDVTIYSTPMGDHRTFIALDFCKAVIPEPVAQKMLDRMVEHIRMFHDDIHGPVGIAALRETATGLPRIPITIPLYSTTLDDDPGPNNGQLSQADNNRDERKSHAMRELVEKAWICVLACQHADLATYWRNQVPFYHVWGDLIASYGLAKYFSDEGFMISMEDVLKSVDMQSQMSLLLRCMQ